MSDKLQFVLENRSSSVSEELDKLKLIGRLSDKLQFVVANHRGSTSEVIDKRKVIGRFVSRAGNRFGVNRH